MSEVKNLEQNPTINETDLKTKTLDELYNLLKKDGITDEEEQILIKRIEEQEKLVFYTKEQFIPILEELYKTNAEEYKNLSGADKSIIESDFNKINLNISEYNKLKDDVKKVFTKFLNLKSGESLTKEEEELFTKNKDIFVNLIDGVIKYKELSSKYPVVGQIQKVKTMLSNIPTPSELSFKDKGNISNWSEKYVKMLAEKGIIKGSNNEFRPQNPATKAEFISMTMNFFGKKGGSSKESGFTDVSSTHWASSIISGAKELGVVTGNKEGKFNPDSSITRAEAATIIAKMYGENINEGSSTFPDAKNHWANKYINFVKQKGIISGFPDGNFRPDELITREQVATILGKITEIKNQQTHKEYIESYNSIGSFDTILGETSKNISGIQILDINKSKEELESISKNIQSVGGIIGGGGFGGIGGGGGGGFPPPIQETAPTMGDVPNQNGTVNTPFTLSIANYVSKTQNDDILEYKVKSGNLPTGLTINTTTGVISGTPTTAGAYTFEVQARDNDGWSNADSLTITIAPEGIDVTPNNFDFINATNSELSTLTESDLVTITGINSPANISVTGGEFSINGGAYTNIATTITNNQTLKLRTTSSGSYNTPVVVSVTVGTVTKTFTVTTKVEAVDNTPPNQPTLTSTPVATKENSVNVEVNGEVGATIWLNGVNTGLTIGAGGKTTVSLDTSGADGDKVFAITLKDTNNNESSALNVTIEKDTVAPSLPTWTTPAPSLKNTDYSSAKITLTDDGSGLKTSGINISGDAGGVVSNISVSGNTITFDYHTPNAAGETLTLTGEDKAGNAFNLTLDTADLGEVTDSTPPETPTLENSAPAYTKNDSENVDVQGEVGSTIWINGTDTGLTIGAGGKTTVSLDTSGADGDKVFAITLKDSNNNESSALNVTIEKDATAPSNVNWIGIPPNLQNTDYLGKQINFTETGSGLKTGTINIVCSSGGTANITNVSGDTITFDYHTPNAPGETLTISGEDEAGNSFSLDLDTDDLG